MQEALRRLDPVPGGVPHAPVTLVTGGSPATGVADESDDLAEPRFVAR